MEIRKMTEQDLDGGTDLFVEIFNDEPWGDQWTLEGTKQYVSDFFYAPNFLGLLAVEDDEIVAFLYGASRAWWSGREFYINEMGVKKEARQKGVGTILLHALEKELEEDKVKYVSLLTDRGMPAEEFYRAIGFEEIERLVFYSKEI